MRTAAFLVTAALFTAGPAIAMSNGWYTAQAKQEVRECLRAADAPGFTIESSTTVVSTCFAGGFITEVNFAKSVDCRPNQPCIALADQLVATVQFGCEDEILWAECYQPGVCEYDGTWYQTDESFPATDGCNTCYCGDEGLVACTRMACL